MEKVDWSQHDFIIAQQLNAPRSSIWKWRRNLGKEAPISFRANRKDRSAVDWSQPNVVIARQLGVSRQRVHQLRIALEK